MLENLFKNHGGMDHLLQTNYNSNALTKGCDIVMVYVVQFSSRQHCWQLEVGTEVCKRL